MTLTAGPRGRRGFTFPELRAEQPEPLREWVLPRLRRSLSVRWRGLAWLAPVLIVGTLVHAWGMFTFPRWVDDPGTYLSQAWAVVYEGSLSPYSYFYDHAPAGWMQIGVWAWLTGGFDRYDSSISFGNECMLLAKMASIVLLYWLCRRLRFGRPAAAGATLLFALSPVAIAYTRWTFLDNLVTPWILLAFGLALSRKRTLIGAIGAGAAFAMAALTKETILVLAPVLLYLLVQNSDRRNRSHVLVMSIGVSTLLMSSYLVYAISKGELFPGTPENPHNSLLGSAVWQLSTREGSGSVFDPASDVSKAISDWLTYDPWLLLGGLVVIPVLVVAPRLRPVALCMLLQILMVVRGGYVPAMQVVAFLPWCALALAGAVEVLRGNPDLQPRWRFGERGAPVKAMEADDLLALATAKPVSEHVSGGARPVAVDAPTVRIPVPPRQPLSSTELDVAGAGTQMLPAVAAQHRREAREAAFTFPGLRTALVAAAVLALLVPVVPRWTSTLAPMLGNGQVPEMYEATQWVADNVPRDEVLVVHDAIWTDFVQRYGYPKDNVVMAYKIDADPAVKKRVVQTGVDYLVVPDWYYTITGKYDTLLEARQHAVPVARFGTTKDAVTVYRVSKGWLPE